jgi:hypothetical protein
MLMAQDSESNNNKDSGSKFMGRINKRYAHATNTLDEHVVRLIRRYAAGEVC